MNRSRRNQQILRPKADLEAIRVSDELLRAVHQALAEDNPDEALALLRRVRRITPLRQEIRLLATQAVTMRVSRYHATPAPAPPKRSTALEESEPLPSSPQPKPQKTKQAPASQAADIPEPQEEPEQIPLPKRPAPQRRQQPQPLSTRHTPSAMIHRVALVGIVAIVGLVIWGSFNFLYKGKQGDPFPKVEAVSLETPLSEALEAQIALSQKELVIGNTVEAITQLEQALKKWPENAETTRSYLGRAYLQNAETLKRDRSWQTALTYYQKAAKMTPKDPKIYQGKGECYEWLGREAQRKRHKKTARSRFRKALTAYDQSLKIKPSAIHARLGKARTLSAQNRRKEAVSLYRSVIVEQPNTPAARQARRGLERLKAKTS